MLLTLAQYSNKTYTFPFSDPTILNYLEGYSNQNSIFEYRGYPTTNLKTYHPGPLPNIYIFKFSWLMHTFFDTNPIYLSNILLVVYPTLLIIIATTILYKNNLKLLSITTLSITWLVQYTSPNSNASNRGPERLDTGTDYITLIATLTLMMAILSYKKPNTSHLPLLAFSGLLLNNHFSAFALAPFTILYALYLIIISIKAKNYKINYKAVIPIIIFIYLPLIYRFIVEPLYLYDALTLKTDSASERLHPDQWTYFYQTTPLQLFINPCSKGGDSFNNAPCLSYTNVQLSLILFAILTLIILYKLIKKQNIFIKLIILIPFILINYNTATGFEAKHSSIASGLFLSILIYYLSKNVITTSIAVIAILILVNYFTIGKNQYITTPTYKKIEKENFSPKFLAEIKNAKFKIDICYLTQNENCTKMRYNKTLIESYYQSNMAHLTILEMLKNKIDICIIDKTGMVTRIKNLICTKAENKDKNRNELYLIRDYNLETPPVLYDYIKIATVITPTIKLCLDSLDSKNSICEIDNQLYESMHHPGTSIYLRKDAKGLDLTKLSFINNQLYEDKLTTLALLNNLGSKCTIYSKDQKNNINYCYKESPQEFILFDPIYKDKAEIYDLR
jgi:hypothetical protein